MTNPKTYQYYKGIFAGARKPFAFVDLDQFDENIRQIKKRASGKSIRIATKSLRCRHLITRILDADPQFHGILSYHPDEAVFLSRGGFDDIVVAYPMWHPPQVENVVLELKKEKNITLMVDCPEHLMHLNAIGDRLKTVIPVCLDIDMSSDFPGLRFGVYRSPLRDSAAVKKLVDEILHYDHVILHGIMGYEAQIAGVGDRTPGQWLKNEIIKLLKRASIKEVQARRRAVVHELQSMQLRFVNAGGTGSLESSTREDWVTEVTAGSGFYSPALFDNYRAFRHQPAAAFALEITRQPASHIFTCLGGGYIGSGAIGKDKLPLPYLPAGARLLQNEGAGEVQTPVRYDGTEALSLGDPIFFRHSKAGELCEHFNQLYLVSNGRITDEVPTYRGEGHCFL